MHKHKLRGSPDELTERAARGDAEAFGELVAIYERYVYNTALNVIRSAGLPPDLAEDVAQETFIKAWRSISSFRSESSTATWLYRIAVNTARDTVRSELRRRSVSTTRDDDDFDATEWDLPVTSGDTVPEDALERSETALYVRRAIESLPEEQRQVVILRDIDDLPYTEIEKILGISLGTVKSRLNRGRANLKAILKKGNFI